MKLAMKIREEYHNYDGFVVTHGTDTMAYAAGMLHFLIQNSQKPIVLTGAQSPIENRDTDARENLRDAFIYASDKDACGIHVVFGGKVISAARARKNRTRSANAFSSVDYPEIGFVRGGEMRYYIKESYYEPVKFYNKIDTNVMLVKLTPGMSADIFDYVAERAHAVIIESFGVGGLPSYDYADFYACIRRHTAKGKLVIMTTQVSNEGSDLAVYHVGHRLKSEAGVLEAYDMTTEAVVAKVMWILAQTGEFDEIRKLFYTPIAFDLLYC
jgi:L-asparaginase